MKNIFLLVGILSSLCCSAMEPEKESLFDRLSRNAEKLYRRSNDNTQQEITTEDLPENITREQTEEKKPSPSILNLSQSHIKPILGKYQEFSLAWWNALFNPCKECKEFSSTINCQELLENNKQWQEVVAMNALAKQLIMKRALNNINQESGPCTIACALCAGADPNERRDVTPNSDTPHTALHLASIYQHYSLFKLLLEQGADPNLKCAPLHPLEFTSDSLWLHTLKEYGSREQEEL